MIRIGIIGCGRILAAHLQAYRLLRDAGIHSFEITALCSRKASDAQSYIQRGAGPVQRKAVSTMPGDPLAIDDEYLSDFQPGVEVEVFTDYEEMIATANIDAVNDFTLHSLHHKIAELCFQHGKHLMSQKPLAITMAAARQMCEQAEQAGVTFGVFENVRFNPETRHLHWAFSADGPIGDFQMALLGNIGTWWAPDLIVAETPWRHELIQAGGIALDLGPHMFNLIRYISGDIKDVSARTSVVEPKRYLLRDGEKIGAISCDADDTFYASFATTSGASGTIFGGWSGHGTPTTIDHGPVFYGSKGRICSDQVHLDGESSAQSLAELYQNNASVDRIEQDFPHGIKDGFALNQLDWLQAILENRQPETSGHEGLMDLACAYAIVESAKAGRTVTIDEILSGELRDYQIPIDQHHGIK
ncbi:MAG: Gfo/Idh/MocA family oxidoreductase [Verrucomicrobiales bacterium]|nr:Gfo/Idh/MocA family oxidoreductase [Verrucomicrobiales bacterium]